MNVSLQKKGKGFFGLSFWFAGEHPHDIHPNVNEWDDREYAYGNPCHVDHVRPMRCGCAVDGASRIRIVDY
jgi:hypothetical protein